MNHGNNGKHQGPGLPFRGLLLLLALCLLLPPARAEFEVIEDAEYLPPNPRQQAQVLMRHMTAEEKIYQLFFVSPEMLTGESYTTKWQAGLLQAKPVGGILLFGQNMVSEAQLRALTEAIQQDGEGGFPLLIGVDEMGGLVSRAANKLGYPKAPAPKDIGDDALAAWQAGETIGAYLSPLGINLDFAPAADVEIPGYEGLKDMTFGPDAYAVAEAASAMAAGLRQGGVTPCYLHFPGQGAVNADLNRERGSVSRSFPEMRDAELLPFARAAGEEAEMILISHAVIRAVDDRLPASLSRPVIQGVLRDQLGFDGVVITDSLRMRAITDHFPADEAAVMALQAGADMLLLPDDLEMAFEGVASALQSGRLSMECINESVERIIALKIRMGLLN